MTAIELKMSLLQEVMSLEDEQLIKKALDSVRRMKMAAFGKATPVEKPADDYAEPTKEEILAGLRNALQDVKDLREGKDVGHKFRDLSELLNDDLIFSLYLKQGFFFDLDTSNFHLSKDKSQRLLHVIEKV